MDTVHVSSTVPTTHLIIYNCVISHYLTHINWLCHKAKWEYKKKIEIRRMSQAAGLKMTWSLQNLVLIFDSKNYDYGVTNWKLFISQKMLMKKMRIQWYLHHGDKLCKMSSKKTRRMQMHFPFIQWGVNKAIFPKILTASKLKKVWDILKQK